MPCSSWNRHAIEICGLAKPSSWHVGHHHGPIGNPDLAHGNGVLLWFEMEDFDAAVARAEELRAEVILPRHRNPPKGDGGLNHWEIWLHDLDGSLQRDPFLTMRYDAGYEIILARYGPGSRRLHHHRRRS